MLSAATTVATAVGGAISQGFSADDELQAGTLVSYADDTPTAKVTAANTNNVRKLVGVVGEQSLVELSNGSGQTQVVTSGMVLAMVSDINGPIRSGDRITASPLTGIGMKAAANGQVVGTAQEDFAAADGVTTRRINDTNGKPQTVKVGLLSVQAGVSYYQATRSNDNSYIPLFIQHSVDDITGKSVGPIRILIAGLIFLLGIGASGVLLYSSVGSSIISIGRNPLSSRAVWHGLLQIAAVTVTILLATLIGAYLILAA